MSSSQGATGRHKTGSDALFESVGPGDLLKLAARDAEDLAVLSTCLQDALAPLKDLAYLSGEKRFVGAFSRFRWETADRADRDNQPYERVHCGFAVNGVRSVRVRGVDRRNRERFHSLLALRAAPAQAANGDGFVIAFVLSGGGAIELSVEEISVMLQDLGLPWPTRFRPDHANALEEAIERAAAGMAP